MRQFAPISPAGVLRAEVHAPTTRLFVTEPAPVTLTVVVNVADALAGMVRIAAATPRTTSLARIADAGGANIRTTLVGAGAAVKVKCSKRQRTCFRPFARRILLS